MELDYHPLAANNLGYKNIHVLEKSKNCACKKYIKNNNIKYYLSNKVITKEYYDNIIETLKHKYFIKKFKFYT